MNPKDTFISAYQKYIHRTGSDSLLDRLLATDFFEAPASTKFHNSFAGGLVLHSLNVFQRMCRNCMNELHGRAIPAQTGGIRRHCIPAA